MKRSRWYWKLLLVPLILAFAYWVWPTPWRQFGADGESWRQNRFTGRAMVFDSGSGPSQPVPPPPAL